MREYRFGIWGGVVVVSAVLVPFTTKAVQPQDSAARSQDKVVTEDVFFLDAFRDALVGERPEHLGRKAAADSNEKASSSRGNARWSPFVSAETLEDEIKRIQMSVSALVSTPARFRSGGFRQARMHFTELAALFAVISEYDQDVRWRKEAPAARALFARAAANAKVSSMQAYQYSKERRRDLETLVRGGGLVAGRPNGQLALQWGALVDREPLMKRLEIATEELILPLTADPRVFAQQVDRLRQEAELLYVFADILMQEGMEDADDEDYEAHCETLREASLDLLRAIQAKDLAGSRKSSAAITKSCNDCHDDYRG